MRKNYHKSYTCRLCVAFSQLSLILWKILSRVNSGRWTLRITLEHEKISWDNSDRQKKKKINFQTFSSFPYASGAKATSAFLWLFLQSHFFAVRKSMRYNYVIQSQKKRKNKSSKASIHPPQTWHFLSSHLLMTFQSQIIRCDKR